jgi:protein TonB
MFEDSTFECTGRIRARNRKWIVAAFAFNASILLALVLVPLFYPQALQPMAMAILLETPPAPVEEPKPVPQPTHATLRQTEMHVGNVTVPTRIPTGIWIPDTREPAIYTNVASMGGDELGAASPDNPFNGHGSVAATVRQAVKPTQRVSSGVMEGMLVSKVLPQYPAIARAIHQSGMVVLAATISRNGTIENLHVVSGPAMLQQAALDAVRQWRYRPYLLNGDPVEVETNINVQFTMQ